MNDIIYNNIFILVYFSILIITIIFKLFCWGWRNYKPNDQDLVGLMVYSFFWPFLIIVFIGFIIGITIIKIGKICKLIFIFVNTTTWRDF